MYHTRPPYLVWWPPMNSPETCTKWLDCDCSQLPGDSQRNQTKPLRFLPYKVIRGDYRDLPLNHTTEIQHKHWHFILIDHFINDYVSCSSNVCKRILFHCLYIFVFSFNMLKMYFTTLFIPPWLETEKFKRRERGPRSNLDAYFGE